MSFHTVHQHQLRNSVVVAAQEATGGLPRFGEALQRDNVRVDRVTHVGWFQRAVSSVQKAAGRLFRFEN
tara:strand:+ start:1351 stop:1557 length:207 start_codon:yes stop_codon:yes gene_type:complete